MIDNIAKDDLWDASEYKVATELDDSTIINLNLHYQDVFVDTVLSHTDEDILIKVRDLLNAIVDQNNIEHNQKDLEYDVQLASATDQIRDLEEAQPQMHNNLYRRV